MEEWLMNFLVFQIFYLQKKICRLVVNEVGWVGLRFTSHPNRCKNTRWIPISRSLGGNFYQIHVMTNYSKYPVELVKACASWSGQHGYKKLLAIAGPKMCRCGIDTYMNNVYSTSKLNKLLKFTIVESKLYRMALPSILEVAYKVLEYNHYKVEVIKPNQTWTRVGYRVVKNGGTIYPMRIPPDKLK